MKKNLLWVALAAVLVSGLSFAQTVFPTITFVSPKGGETVKFPVRLEVSLSNAANVKKVEFVINNELVAETGNWPPFVGTWENSSGSGNWKDGSYRVEAKVFVGGGYTSSAISATLKNQNVTPPPTLVKPATPKGFTGTALSSSEISLKWEASPTAKGYTLKMAVEGKPIPTPRLTTETSYTSSGLPASSDVYCSLTAYNDAGESAPTAITVRTRDLIKPTKTAYIPEDFYSLQEGVNWAGDKVGLSGTVVLNARAHDAYEGFTTLVGKPVRIVVVFRYDDRVRGIEAENDWRETQVVISNSGDVVVMSGFSLRTRWYDRPTIRVCSGASFALMDSDVRGSGRLIEAISPKLVHVERVNFIGSMWASNKVWAIYIKNAQSNGPETGVKIFECGFFDISAIDMRESPYPPQLSKDGRGDSNRYHGGPVEIAQ